MLYTEGMLQGLTKQLNRRWLVLGSVAAVLLGVFIWSLVIRYDYDDRLQWISVAAIVILGFFAVFWIDNMCGPLLRYRRVVRDALTGRRHTVTMPFVRTEDDLSVAEGIPCHGLIFLGEPDKHGTRDQLLYWDAEIPMPDLETGKEYTVGYCGKMIVEISA